MLGYSTMPKPPADDRRWKLVDATMRRHGYAPNALIEVLHTVQESFGFLTEEALRYVAEALRLPYSKVYGVATFYHYFSMKPPGEHICVVCTGTACYIKGAPALLDRVAKEADIKPDETTKNGKLSLMTARCIGACGLAPAVVFDREIVGKATPDVIGKWVKQHSQDGAEAPAVEIKAEVEPQGVGA